VVSNQVGQLARSWVNQMAKKVVVIGAGVMGEVLVAAAKKARSEVFTVEADPARAAEISNRHEVKATELGVALGGSDTDTTVWLAVKPQQIDRVLTDIETHLAGTPVAQRPLFVSLAAGVGTDHIHREAPSITRLIRIMPNTPARIGRGVTALVAVPLGNTPAPTEQDITQACSVLDALGSVERVTEAEVDAVTAVAGSGPAYLFYLAEAMTEAATSLGLSNAQAERLVNETLAGSAELLRVSNEAAAKLRGDVTSKGGVTLAATSYLDDNAIKSQLIAAIKSAHDRAREIGRVSTSS
jgi:pyrroline-5-carboxylate reductase